MYFQLYQDKAGEWRWKLKAGNHEVIADSSEGYKQKASALHGIELVKGCAAAEVKEITSA